MTTRVLAVLALVSAGLLAAPADASARDRRDREPRHEQRDERQPREERQSRDERRESLRDARGDHRRADRSADAARRAQQQNGGGRVLSVEPDDGGYRVKVLKDGEVRTHRVEED